MIKSRIYSNIAPYSHPCYTEFYRSIHTVQSIPFNPYRHQIFLRRQDLRYVHKRETAPQQRSQQQSAHQGNSHEEVTIRRAPGIRLQPNEVALLRQAFYSPENATEPRSIFIEREFRSGYSGALVLLASLNSAQAPVVVKLAPPP